MRWNGLGRGRAPQMSNTRVFHALRKTFTEAMAVAEVPESTTKPIIGHARQSLTCGHYSKGERVRLREHINKLYCVSGVMRLIREPMTNKNSNPEGGRSKWRQTLNQRAT